MHKQTAMITVWKHIGRKMYEKWFSESICRDSHDDEYTPPWIVKLNNFSRIYESHGELLQNINLP